MEMLIPIAFFAMIAAICIVPGWLKSRERSEMQNTLRAAIDKGQPMPPEVIDALTKNVKQPSSALSDLRTGVIWIAIGIGIGVFGYFVSYEADEAFRPMLGIGAIPVIIGATFVILSFFNPNKGKPV
ncbi:MAG: hypothetical protein EON95_13725 [Caulobacteraceae bacterium]|nr:DUF6249 domain-containing protein [Caulobacter sp.]RYF92051.1 MAG: hypothetical protein EON95_13725 [Caulobacteraceae bacterium]